MPKNEKWKTVSIPTPLYQIISGFVDSDPRYHSISEFVSEAVRRRLEELADQKEVGA